MKTVLLATALVSTLASLSQARALDLDCATPVVTVGGTDPGPDPVASLSISYNPGAWRVVYTLASGATINRADQYAMGDVSDAKGTQWAGTLSKRPKLYMNGTIFRGDAGAFVYREILFDMSKPGGPQQQVVMSMTARCTLAPGRAAPVAVSTPAPKNVDGLNDLDSFNKFFKESIAQGQKLGTPIERFSEEKQVGWEQTIIIETKVVKLTVLLSPPSTFSIKHLCIGDTTSQPLELACVSNLGQSWLETKNAAGAWVQHDTIDLPWHRDLAALAFN
jgi:hypothetical protein